MVNLTKRMANGSASNTSIKKISDTCSNEVKRNIENPRKHTVNISIDSGDISEFKVEALIAPVNSGDMWFGAIIML